MVSMLNIQGHVYCNSFLSKLRQALIFSSAIVLSPLKKYDSNFYWTIKVPATMKMAF